MVLLLVARQPGTLTLQLALNDTPEKLGPTDTTTTSAVLLASAYFDFKFLGKPQQCDNEVACAEFEKQHSWDKWMDQGSSRFPPFFFSLSLFSHKFSKQRIRIFTST